MNKLERIEEIEKELALLKAQCKEEEYPKYMLAYTLPKDKQYIVKFTSINKGTIVSSSCNSCYKIGYVSTSWTQHTNTDIWKEVTNPNELCDKDLVRCWNNISTYRREIKFYDSKYKRTFSYKGRRHDDTFANYEKIMPWDEETVFGSDVEEERASLED